MTGSGIDIKPASSSRLLNVGELHSPNGCESLLGNKNQVCRIFDVAEDAVG